MIEKKKLPLSVSEFPRLIKENYLYVDKTPYIHKMMRQGGAFFLSRPRRFGKSLLVSTLKEIYEGNRDLFKDTWIYDRINWEKYTVLHLDFLGVDYQELGLNKALNITLDLLAEDFLVTLKGESISGKFRELIKIGRAHV